MLAFLSWAQIFLNCQTRKYKKELDICNNHCEELPDASRVHHYSPCPSSSQFEDADEEWMAQGHVFSDDGCWFPPPDSQQESLDKEIRTDVHISVSDQENKELQCPGWTLEDNGAYLESDFSKLDKSTDKDWYDDSPVAADNMSTDLQDVCIKLENTESSGTLMDQQGNQENQKSVHELPFTEDYEQISINSMREDSYIDANNPCSNQNLAEDGCPNTVQDDSLALVPFVPSTESPCSSPPVSPPLRSGSSVNANTAASATGIPLHSNPFGIGQARFVRIHPLHIAAAVAAQRSQVAAVAAQRSRVAAVAAQRSRVAAVVQQQTRIAAVAAAQQHAAAAQRQAAAAAAAARQRTQAALIHQQLVRSRYMGAPVLVRPSFMPVPRVAAPVRLRMRVRRSVMMTEELSVDHA